MEKKHIFLFIIVFVILFLLVYSPHSSNHFPLHVDEWHHIHESINLRNGDYNFSSSSFRIGFQLFLAGLSFFISLVKFYFIFPAIWAVFSGLVLAVLVYKKTENIWISLLSVFFFASIKSNVNLGGLWFFTSLTFSIPFIFAFIYFFSEGLEKENKKSILLSFLIIVLLIPTHIISFSFAIPFLFIYSFIYFKFIKREWKFFSMFLLIPFISFIFFNFILRIKHNFILKFFNAMSFKYGWGVLELNNSFLEVYSLIGFLFAIVGFFVFLFSKRKHLIYLIWPVVILFSIFFYRIFHISFFAPYQRNMFYFVLAMPFLSARGFYFVIKKINIFLIKHSFSKRFAKLILYLIIFVLLFGSLMNYFVIPKGLEVYYPINQNQFEALNFLKNQPQGIVIVPIMQGDGVFPISGHRVFSSIYFYNRNNKRINKEFFYTTCPRKNEIIKLNNISYVFSNSPINCGWKKIYNKTSFIYNV